MELNLIKEGILNFGIFILIAVATILIMFWSFKRLKLKRDNLEDFTTSNGIFLGGVIFSVFYLMTSVITPITSSMKLLNDTTNSWSYAFELSKYSSLFIFIVLISAFITCAIAFQIVKRFFKGIKIIEALDNNHIGLSILSAIILICFSILVKESLQPILDSFVPYPEMPNLLNQF